MKGKNLKQTTNCSHEPSCQAELIKLVLPSVHIPCLGVCHGAGDERLQGDRMCPCPELLGWIPLDDRLGQFRGNAQVSGRRG